MWVETNNCKETMHIIRRTDKGVVCTHSDDSVCEEAEYQAPELKEVA